MRGRQWIVTLLVTAWPVLAAPGPGLEIRQSHPHDAAAFTQGLLYDGGVLYESTGRYGSSSVRRVCLETGEVLAQRALPERYFGEGLARVGDRLIQLTWKAGVGFVYDRKTLKMLARFEYPGQGWGLTYDGRRLIMSDGSNRLRFLDPLSFKQTGSIAVTRSGRPIPRLNELEYIAGEVWANVWPTDHIVRVDPETGYVKSIIDAGFLRERLPAGYKTDVLNGIAYDADQGRLFVTGKLWPRLFEVSLQPVE